MKLEASGPGVLKRKPLLAIGRVYAYIYTTYIYNYLGGVSFRQHV